jgi:two-component system sensor histidine kinase FlrB
VELQQAFASFNQLSRQLIDSYQTLERGVSRLGATVRGREIEPRVGTSTDDIETGRLRQVLDALPGGVVVIDGDGVIQDHNPATTELIGFAPRGRLWREVIEQVFAPRPDDGHDISLRDGRRVKLSTTPLGGEPGQIVLITDVTNTRALQDKLHQYERLSSLGEMAAGLAHQLRTPLSAAILHLGLLKQDSAAIDRRAVAEKTLARLRHIEALVRDMLSLARTDHTPGETVTPAQIVCELEQAIAPTLPVERVTAQFIDDTRGVRVRVHRELLLSALSNLVHNAVEAMPDGGRLIVRARAAHDDYVEICVIDSGVGMAEDVQRRIGEPFFTTRDNGTGLGVAVVNAVAKAHQGFMTFSSRSGAGSTFIVRLPILPEREHTD